MLPTSQISTFFIESHIVKVEQYIDDRNLNVRQLFNQQKKEDTTDNFIKIASYFFNSSFLEAKGNTLEIGAGNGLFWKLAASLLLDPILSQGKLYVTDISAGMLTACRAVNSLAREGVIIEEADATQLPYADDSVARVFGNFMLYECKTPAKIHAALSEVRRVLKDEGQFIAVTMDEKIHMVQLYATLQKAKDNLAKKGIYIKTQFPMYAPAVMPFCAGNAHEYLSNYFAEINVIEQDNAILIDNEVQNHALSGAQFVAKYLQSLEFVQEAMQNQELPDLFFDEIQSLIQEEINTQGVFRITRREVFLHCAKPFREKTGAQLSYMQKV